MKLAVAMSEDDTCFVAGNHFESDKTIMEELVRQLELTGRVANRKFFIEVEIPTTIKLEVTNGNNTN